MSYRDHKRKPISDINVVPYIDVMLVLLIIFMVTAPLLTQGVQVDLPQSKATTIAFNEKAPEPFILTVDVDGQMYIDEFKKTPEEVFALARALYNHKPETDFLVRGDKKAIYDNVLQAMVLLKNAGVENVSLVTESARNQKNNK